MNKLKKTVQSYWFIIVAFLLLVGPLALEYHFNHHDEHYYTDAAIQMIKTHDYFTPHFSSGELRFEKPIITYWMVALGFKLFGINTFASRFFFLLAAALVLILVNKGAFLISESKKTAYLATAIAATQILIIMGSLRSIPDILLCLFVTLSAVGIIGLIKYGNETPKRYLWILYLGIALAIEVKGIPALALGAIAMLYLVYNPWKRIRIKTLFHIPSILVSIAVALFWFANMYFYHGDFFVNSFYNDQIGIRFTHQPFKMLKNFLLAGALIIALYLPWNTMLKRRIFHYFKTCDVNTRLFFDFTILWVLTIIMLSGFVLKFYERYLLPVAPLVSIFLAILISINKTSSLNRKYKSWGFVLLFVNLFANSLQLYFNLAAKSSIWATALVIIILTLTLLTYFIFEKKEFFLSRLVILILLIPLNLSVITWKLSVPNEGHQITTLLKDENIRSNQNIGFYGNSKTLSRIKISSKDFYSISLLTEDNYCDEMNKYNILIGSDELLSLLNPSEFEIIEASTSWNSKKSKELTKGLLKGKYQEYLKIHGRKYYLLYKK